MCSMFSQLGQLFKKNLSASQIKIIFVSLCKKVCGFFVTTYRRTKEMYETDNAKAYRAFACRVCKRLFRAFKWAWGVFGIALTYLYLTQGLSLLFEGKSGTMTVEFTSKWLIFAVSVAGILFCAMCAEAIYETIRDFTSVRHRLKIPAADKDSSSFVTLAVFEQFRDETRSELIGINKRLDDIDSTLKKLVGKNSRRRKQGMIKGNITIKND